MFVKMKYNPDGSEDKVKARLVAGGDRQDKTAAAAASNPKRRIITKCLICEGTELQPLQKAILWW
jgi:hypothetical protein